MKKLLLLLTFAVSMPTFSQIDANCLETRKVISHTATLWLNNYRELQRTKLIGSDTTYNKLLLTKSNFDSLSFHSETDCDTITFRFYMTPDTVLHSAIELDKDNYYTYTKEKGWHFSKKSDLKEHFIFWMRFAKNIHTPFVYVNKYYYNANEIIGFFKDSTSSITIENVVHFVSPDSQRYEVNKKYLGQSGIEGLLAFDILIRVKTPIDTPIEIPMDHYNFAVPCPKNCRTAIE